MKNLETNIKAFVYSVSPLVFAIGAFYIVYLLIVALFAKC